MIIKTLPTPLSVCQLESAAQIDPTCDFFFAARTATEVSFVCPSEAAPPTALKREDGWRAFYIDGTLDFSLVGILSPIAALMAENAIGIFAVSTYDTDYVLVRAWDFARALELLAAAGYEVLKS